MHVAATNIILWIRTLVKETIEEITEVEGEKLEKMELEYEHGHETVNNKTAMAKNISVSLRSTLLQIFIMKQSN